MLKSPQIKKGRLKPINLFNKSFVAQFGHYPQIVAGRQQRFDDNNGQRYIYVVDVRLKPSFRVLLHEG